MQKNLDRLEMALSGGKVSVWDWDIPSEEVHRSYDWHKTQEHNEFYKPGDLGDWRGWVHPDDRELAFSVLNDFSQGKQSHYEVEYRMQRPGEKWRWVRERGKATEYSQEGLPIRAVGTLMDIHHRKTTEAELLESQRKFSALLVNLPGMAYRCTNDSRWTMEYVSKGAGDLFECDASELMDDSGFKHMGRIYYEDIEKVENTVEQSLLDRSHFQITYRIVTAKDNIKWVWEQAGFVCDSKGEVIALEGFIIDISREKEAESAELEKAKLAAAIETAGAACHELSQPLQVLMAKLELMMMSKPDDDPLLAELNQLSVYAQTMAEITHKLNRLTQYHTTDYIGDARILDLNRSAGYRF